MNSPPPYSQYIGMAQRLLDAEWISSPVVEAAQYHLAAVPEMDLGAPHLSPPLLPAVQPATEAAEVSPGGMGLGKDETSLPLPSPPLAATPDMIIGAARLTPLPSPTVQPVTTAADDQLHSLLEPPPPRSKGRKGKARARTPPPAPSPPRTPLTRAAAKLAAAPHQEVAPRCPGVRFRPPSKLLAEQFTLLLGNGPMTLTPPVCTACRLKRLKPEECIVPPGEHGCEQCKRNRHSICSFRAKLKDQVPNFEASVEVSQLSLTNLHKLFGRLHRTSALNLVQREYVRQSKLEMSALSCEISSSLHRLVAMDPDNSFQELYIEDNEAMAALVDVLSPFWNLLLRRSSLDLSLITKFRFKEGLQNLLTLLQIAKFRGNHRRSYASAGRSACAHPTLVLPMTSNNQVDASNTPLAYSQNLCDIWDGRSHTTPEEQVAIKEARFTALFNAAHNLDTAQIHLQDEYPIPEFTAFMQAFLDYHDAVPEGTIHRQDAAGFYCILNRIWFRLIGTPCEHFGGEMARKTTHLAWKLASEGVDKVIQHIEDKHVICYLNPVIPEE
ncbi:hypothetical protein BDZ97DRAFT_1765589 [Flammula alnicola]|nr:hypothetical protein BDZ97DRAFT_1765589 [Flammula alnicola]